MDCPICTNQISDACVCTCMHHFCYPCLLQWINVKPVKTNKKIPNCPVCRQSIYDIRFDREFDNIIHGSEFPSFKHPNELVIDFQEKLDSLTIKNHDGPGVEIVRIIKTSVFYNAGLRKGHVLLFINNIPCNNHKSTVDIISHCQISRIPLIINTLTKI